MEVATRVVLASGGAPTLASKKLVEVEVGAAPDEDLDEMVKAAENAFGLRAGSFLFLDAEGAKIETGVDLQGALERSGGGPCVLDVRSQLEATDQNEGGSGARRSLTSRMREAERRLEALETHVVERIDGRIQEMQRVEALETHVVERIGARCQEMQRVEALETHVVERARARCQEIHALECSVLESVDAKLLEVRALNAVSNVTAVHKSLESQILEKADARMREKLEKADGTLARVVAKVTRWQQETHAKLQALEDDVVATKAAAGSVETATAASRACSDVVVAVSPGLACALTQLDDLCCKLTRQQQETRAKLQALEDDVVATKAAAVAVETATAASTASSDAVVSDSPGLACALTQLDDLCCHLARKLEETKDGEAEIRQQLAEVGRQAQHADDGVEKLLARDSKRDLGVGNVDFASALVPGVGFSYSSKSHRLAPLKVGSTAMPFASRGPSALGLDRVPSCPNFNLLPPVR